MGPVKANTVRGSTTALTPSRPPPPGNNPSTDKALRSGRGPTAGRGVVEKYKVGPYPSLAATATTAVEDKFMLKDNKKKQKKKQITICRSTSKSCPRDRLGDVRRTRQMQTPPASEEGERERERRGSRTIQEIVLTAEARRRYGLDLQEWFEAKARVTEQEAAAIAESTMGQRENPTWKRIRRGMLTASNFGVVLRRSKFPDAFLRRLVDAPPPPSSLSEKEVEEGGEGEEVTTAATAWGVIHEDDAVRSFEKSTGLEARRTGIWLHESGFLGASPDGLVGDDAVLEVKCPYAAKDMTPREAAAKLSRFCLAEGKEKREKEDDNGGSSSSSSSGSQLSLKRSHPYWHQVQAQIFFTGRKRCYFVVWTPKDVVVLEIPKEENWKRRLDQLQEFYLAHLLPKLME